MIDVMRARIAKAQAGPPYQLSLDSKKEDIDGSEPSAR
jgi:hypothetical protein